MKKYSIILGSLWAFTALGATAGLWYLLEPSGGRMGFTPNLTAYYKNSLNEV